MGRHHDHLDLFLVRQSHDFFHRITHSHCVDEADAGVRRDNTSQDLYVLANGGTRISVTGRREIRRRLLDMDDQQHRASLASQFRRVVQRNLAMLREISGDKDLSACG
jgi:hypothetical protein